MAKELYEQLLIKYSVNNKEQRTKKKKIDKTS